MGLSTRYNDWKEVITAVFISMVLLNTSPTLYLTNLPQKINMLHMLLTFLTMSWQPMLYNINVTSPSGQQETFKILINPEHLRQTLER
ncbi:alpha-amylase [Escherichia coli]|uniref:Alpha-amylase n=1 Tax=Escherichia coli TaxID=562 RepID=A0A2X1KCU5_ECOLX|nr:alpha-amylase [Escherichia coli]